jgi:preprotein translocase subunit YajC
VNTILAVAAILQAQQPAAPGRTGAVMLIYLVAFGAIFWFLILGPQRKMQKRHQAMIAGVKKGDEVMTEGGIIGTVVHTADDRITLKTAESTRIVVARPKIARVLGATSE